LRITIYFQLDHHLTTFLTTLNWIWLYHL